MLRPMVPPSTDARSREIARTVNATPSDSGPRRDRASGDASKVLAGSVKLPRAARPASSQRRCLEGVGKCLERIGDAFGKRQRRSNARIEARQVRGPPINELARG